MKSVRVYNYLFILILIVFVFLLFPNNYIIAKNRICDIYIINSHNKKVKIKIEIADTIKSKAQGLMHRKKLAKNSGMLFIFNKAAIRNFWMKNTYIPLSIAYLNREGVISEIHNMKPLDTSITYPSKKPAMFAIEVNKGWFKNNNIKIGCKISFNGCFGK